MPTISFFYGIIIRMYFGDHPPAHFHAVYGEHEALISIETGGIIFGRLPKTAARIVKDWTVARNRELRDNWTRAQKLQPLERIPGPEDE
jgi:hypothetical protein